MQTNSSVGMSGPVFSMAGDEVPLVGTMAATRAGVALSCPAEEEVGDSSLGWVWPGTGVAPAVGALTGVVDVAPPSVLPVGWVLGLSGVAPGGTGSDGMLEGTTPGGDVGGSDVGSGTTCGGG